MSSSRQKGPLSVHELKKMTAQRLAFSTCGDSDGSSSPSDAGYASPSAGQPQSAAALDGAPAGRAENSDIKGHKSFGRQATKKAHNRNARKKKVSTEATKQHGMSIGALKEMTRLRLAQSQYQQGLSGHHEIAISSQQIECALNEEQKDNHEDQRFQRKHLEQRETRGIDNGRELRLGLGPEQLQQEQHETNKKGEEAQQGLNLHQTQGKSVQHQQLREFGAKRQRQRRTVTQKQVLNNDSCCIEAEDFRARVSLDIGKVGQRSPVSLSKGGGFKKQHFSKEREHFADHRENRMQEACEQGERQREKGSHKNFVGHCVGALEESMQKANMSDLGVVMAGKTSMSINLSVLPPAAASNTSESDFLNTTNADFHDMEAVDTDDGSSKMIHLNRRRSASGVQVDFLAMQMVASVLDPGSPKSASSSTASCNRSRSRAGSGSDEIFGASESGRY